jgi:cytochrome c-type biogenesis protein CcmH/NrfG
MIRGAAAAVAVAAMALLLALWVDVGRWEHADARPPTLVGRIAENLLATSDDIALRRAVRRFTIAERTPYGFDNGANQARVRALAQGTLADVVASAGAPQASQADDLLGVLAWGGTGAPSGAVAPADRAVSAFTDAARLDPRNVDAEFNLELALRALQSHGVRRGAGPSSGTRGTGHSGAGAGLPGQGY